MSLFVFANFYSEYVTAYCSSTSATISVSSASSLPALGVDQVIPLVLTNAATESVFEIVYVTAVSGTTLTILRAQEGTIAQNWQVNDLISCDPTAASVGASNISPATTSSQPVPLGQALNVVAVTATGNITLGNVLKTLVSADGATAAITLTLEPGTVVGQEVTFRSNAYGYTVQSNVTTGAPEFLLADGTGVYSLALPAGQSTVTLQWDGTNWHCKTTGLGGTMVCCEQQPSGTIGGASIAGVQSRVLNTILWNTIPGASLSSNEITLPAGTYDIYAEVPAYDVNAHRAYLFIPATSTISLLGMNSYCVYSMVNSVICGAVTFATTTTFNIQHWTSAAVSDGLGLAASMGQVEQYTTIKIKKVG